MATAVVSGRVSEEVKREVDRILERAGKTPGDVIRDVWVTIYQTGKLPTSPEQEEELLEKRRRFKEFVAFIDGLPPAPRWLSSMSDEELRDMMVDDMIEEERHFLGGDLYVPAHD